MVILQDSAWILQNMVIMQDSGRKMVILSDLPEKWLSCKIYKKKGLSIKITKRVENFYWKSGKTDSINYIAQFTVGFCYLKSDKINFYKALNMHVLQTVLPNVFPR